MTEKKTKKTLAPKAAVPKKATAKKIAVKKAVPKAKKIEVSQDQGDLLDGLDIGRRLERARKAKKMTLQQASEKTQIRAATLQALEQNRFEELPEIVYVRGFIRIYAQLLELDAQQLLRDLSRYLKTEEQTTLTLPTPVEEGALPSMKVILMSLVVVALMGGVWSVVDRPTHNVIGEGAEIPITHKHETLPNRTPQPIEQAAIEQAEPATAFERPVNLETPQAAEVKEAAVAPTVIQAQTRIHLKATEDVWLAVYKHEAELPVYTGVMKAGEGFDVPNEQGFLLDVGLPPALTLYVDGQRLGISGVIDRRVRGLPLDPEYLIKTYYPEGIYAEVNITLPQKPKTPPIVAPNVVADPQKAIVEVPQVVIQEEAVPPALPRP